MLLEKITLNNWRCFYGEQQIEFASATDRNVTLIHAENGVGKTSLLNALLWCFYQKNTSRFEKPDDILNQQAAREGQIVAFVAIEFSHEDNRYEARRSFRKGTGVPHLIVTKISEDGTQEQVRNDPKLFINSVLPSDMASHFLFDGEHAEALTGRANSATVARAIKDILGCAFVVQSIDALEPVEASYRRNITSQNTLQQISKIDRDLKQKKLTASKIISKLDALDGNTATMETERESIERSLSRFADIRQAQLTKSNLVSAIDREKKYIKRSEVKKQTWANENAIYVNSQKLVNDLKNILNSIQDEDKNKTKFNKEVIEQILALDQCVCGTCVSTDIDLKNFLMSQLDSAESLELKTRIDKVRRLHRKLERTDIAAKKRDFEDAKQSYDEHLETLKKSEVSLTEVTRAIENADVESIADLQRKSSELYRSILEKKQIRGELSLKLRAVESQIPKLQTELDSMSVSSSSDILHKKNLKLAQRIRQFLAKRLETEINGARRIINTYISEIIEKTARKDFKVIVDKNFTVLLKDKFGSDMAKSEGENQLLGLAFTGALAKFAKLRKNASGKILLPGTEAPLVLDAPFGKLDSVYKHATAAFLPEMASQVIVMVNKEQGSQKVLELLEDYIGYQYALVRHNTSPQNQKATETLTVRDRELQITCYESSFDGTAIELI